MRARLYAVAASPLRDGARERAAPEHRNASSHRKRRPMSGLEDKLVASLEPPRAAQKEIILFGKKKKKSFATKLTQERPVEKQAAKPKAVQQPTTFRAADYAGQAQGAAPTSRRRTTARSRRYLLRYMLPGTLGGVRPRNGPSSLPPMLSERSLKGVSKNEIPSSQNRPCARRCRRGAAPSPPHLRAPTPLKYWSYC